MGLGALAKRSALSVLAPVVASARYSTRRREGLLTPVTRAEFLASTPAGKSILELGPFDAPLMRGSGIAYFDVLDRNGLQRRAVQEGRDPAGCPVIDYVSATGDLSMVQGKFDVVFSSHVIEHQHDLIGHLNAVDDLLRPGAAYHLIVPDKRYCFDHFTPESSLNDALVAADEGAAGGVERAIRHVHFDLAHNDALKHWFGFHGNKLASSSEENCKDDIARYRGGEYRDIHAFKFTPGSFASIMTELYRSGRSLLRPVKVYDTRIGELEFYAVLKSDHDRATSAVTNVPMNVGT